MTMDPDETLRLIREACTRFEQGATYEDMDELVEHFRALDQWIRRGGVPPRDWTRDHPTIHRDEYTATRPEPKTSGWSYAELFPDPRQ